MSALLLERALVYAARGLAVFPCAPRSKEPACAHGFKDATSDVAQVEQWWWRTPRANIATPTGITFDVVDFDSLDVYEQAGNVHGLVGPQVRTARGAHFYVEPTGRCSTKLTPSIDCKGAGGYVLLPPSVHPTGTVYGWLEEGDPKPAPAWLRELLERGRPRPVRHRGRGSAGGVHLPTARGVASLRAMAERLAHEPAGNRNALLFWSACTAADTGIPADDVAIVLGDAARRAGLEDREINRTLVSAFKEW